jgi:beta-phosphoglucomutase-like phosphatase (HAD superfamily)
MSEEMFLLEPFDVDAIDTVLCDADGTLFDSEPAAFAASTTVMNRLLASLGIDRTYTPDGLRGLALGRNFRSTASALAADAGAVIEPGVLERWVAAEQAAVTEELATVLRPTPNVRLALEVLRRERRLSVVTSSAAARVDACLDAAGLDDLFPHDVRFSAEDSLATPASKPDPAIYRFVGAQLDVGGVRAVAVEDAVAGARAAVEAGFPTVGMLQFVPPNERAERTKALRDAGVVAVVPSWRHLVRLLARRRRHRYLVD